MRPLDSNFAGCGVAQEALSGREFLAGGGAMGARMRDYDWSHTPLVPYRLTLDTSCTKKSHQIICAMMVAAVRRSAAAVAARPALVR